MAAVADGAGGLSGGAEAADLLVTAFGQLVADGRKLSSRDLEKFLIDTDAELLRTRGAGETTALLAAVADGQILGASVGDSEAWLVEHDAIRTLTAGQRRKPLLGSGDAIPTCFGPVPFEGRLVLATDGLFKYITRAALLEESARSTTEEAPANLARRVRLPSGALQDDIAVIVLDTIEPAIDSLHATAGDRGPQVQ